MKIEFGDCHIREYDADDAPALVRYANNHKVWRNLRDRFPHPYTHRDAFRWLRQVGRQIPAHDFAIATEKELIGAIGLQFQDDVHRRSAEIGYWLGEPHWGKGIATRAVCCLTEFAFANTPLVRIYANVFEWNPASARVLEKAGYSYEGRLRKSVLKDDQLIDQLVYSVLRS
jgi:RimJ/RimL family protein N-acetyltransferase